MQPNVNNNNNNNNRSVNNEKLSVLSNVFNKRD